jgi:hypothetical protein
MDPIRQKLAEAIENTKWQRSVCERFAAEIQNPWAKAFKKL